MDNFLLLTPAQSPNNSPKTNIEFLRPLNMWKKCHTIFCDLSCMTWNYLEVKLGIYSFRKTTFPKDPYNLDLQQLPGIVAGSKIFRALKSLKLQIHFRSCGTFELQGIPLRKRARPNDETYRDRFVSKGKWLLFQSMKA